MPPLTYAREPAAEGQKEVVRPAPLKMEGTTVAGCPLKVRRDGSNGCATRRSSIVQSSDPEAYTARDALAITCSSVGASRLPAYMPVVFGSSVRTNASKRPPGRSCGQL